jgi:hypothetical protein
VAISGGAKAQPVKDPDQCLLTRNIDSFDAIDDHTVYVRASVDQIWRLTLINDCLELPFRLSIGVERAGGDPWICKPIQATVVTRGVAVPHRCPVVGLHRLTPDEVAALPKGVKP